ncbi:MAG: GTP-binding protein [Geminicoccaceae bacterium]
MSTEVSAASFAANGLQLNVLDCPGSVEFVHEMQAAVLGCDLAVVVLEPRARAHDRGGPHAPISRRQRDPPSRLRQQDGPLLGGALPRSSRRPARPERASGGAAPVRDRPRRRISSAISTSNTRRTPSARVRPRT